MNGRFQTIRAGRVRLLSIPVAAAVAWSLMGASSCADSGGSSGPSNSSAPVAPLSHTLNAANVTQSLRATADGFLTSNWDNLKVQVNSGGQVAIVAKPNATWDEQNFITVEAEDTLVAVKAIKGWYTDVTVIHVQLNSDFTDQYGATKTEPGAWIEVTSDTFNKMNPDGLKDRDFEQPTDLFALADAYYVHPAVWKNIDDKHRGQLTTFADGTAVVTDLPS
jgi:hypothetical protein